MALTLNTIAVNICLYGVLARFSSVREGVGSVSVVIDHNELAMPLVRTTCNTENRIRKIRNFFPGVVHCYGVLVVDLLVCGARRNDCDACPRHPAVATRSAAMAAANSTENPLVMPPAPFLDWAVRPHRFLLPFLAVGENYGVI